MTRLIVGQGGQLIRQDAGPAAHALVLAQCITGVERPAAAHGVAQTIGERADPGAFEIDLRGNFKAIALVGIPAFAKEVDIRVQRFNAFPGREDLRFRVVAHQVEAEAIDLIIGGPYRQ